ncbi:MAG: FHA domain-containing protein [Clostridiales bacterium]|nr:FHA domain-containing protein [Clostridiales bacterium]
MKTLTRALAIALLAMMLTACAVSSIAAFKLETLDSVVLVYMDIVYDGEYIASYAGTGFFIGEKNQNPQYIITNQHVIDIYEQSGGGQGESMLVIAYDSNTFEEAYVVASDAEKDLAILKIANPTTMRKPLFLRSTESSMVGATAYAVGYPIVADLTKDAVSAFGRDDATVTSGIINRIITESGTGRKVLQMDVNIRGGNSGGPLVDENGFVVGINTETSLLAEALNYAVSVDELIPLLKNNNIPFVLDRSIDPMLLLYIGLGLLGVVLIVVLIVVLTKKKPEPVMVNAAPAPQAPAPTPAAPMVRPSLRSMAAQHGGMTVELSSAPILIGRDVASCRIVFTGGTPGVSARHCQVTYDAASGSFVLVDLQSTYGTFLSSGQKLLPGVPYTLKARDSFYLGDPSNALYVDLI